ncbi:MAG: hypothetical protein LBQ27_04695 [Clostridiales bacterium]|jgi:hypothetical protein|nr:hypothetical protein [Clostridiales bacterium]
MLVLEKRMTVDESNKHIKFPFYVNGGAKRMEICFSFSPKNIQEKEYSKKLLYEGLKKYMPESKDIGNIDIDKYLPLKNLLTISLDAPSGKYAGAAHRHSESQKHIISEDFSSPGFFPIKIEEGEWTIVVTSFLAQQSGVCFYLSVDLLCE